MGAWGIGNFENDDSLDWCDELLDCSDKQLIMDSLEEILAGEETPDSVQCAMAVCSAEIIAAFADGETASLPEDVTEWITEINALDKHNFVFEKHEITKAMKAVKKILTESELKDLWEESDEYKDWAAIQKELIGRLQDACN